MDRDEQIYVALQRHLDNQAVGFPATRSGAELRILKHIFTPAEAAIVAHLSYKLEPLETIFEKVGHLVETTAALGELLDRVRKKGGIECRTKNGRLHYGCAPLVVGMYELQLGRLTPQFLRDFNQYTADRKFGVAFLSTELPQMRTVPVSKSITVRHQVSTFDDVAALLERAEDPFVVAECICRKKKAMEGKACRMTGRKETCLAVGSVAQMLLQSGNGRKIARDEALALVEKNQHEGLVLQPSNTETVDFICSCCGCCCGMLAVHRSLPKPLDFWAANFFALVDAGTCEGCGICEQMCQVGAIAVSKQNRQAVVDRNRCIGCGVCVARCPNGSVSLSKKAVEVRPPKTREDLYDIIMARKKSRLEKLKLTGRLLADAVRMGRTDLIK